MMAGGATPSMKHLSDILMIRPFVLAAAFLLAACAGVEGPAPSNAQLTQLKAQIYVHIEEERLKLNGEAKPLVQDSALEDAAQAHSDAMAKRRAFDSGGAGDNVAIQQLAASPTFRGYVAENSAMQYFNPASGIDTDAFARGFVQIWLGSPEHKTVIVFSAFDKTGIGIAVTGNRIYAAELFAAPLDSIAP